jgi:hypothetical protein
MRLWEVVAVGIAFGLLGLVLAVYVMPRARRGAGVVVLVSAAAGLAGGLYGRRSLSGFIAAWLSLALWALLGEGWRLRARQVKGTKRGSGSEVAEVVERLVRIGECVDMVPAGDQAWCGMLGLHVRMGQVGGYARLWVSDGVESRVEARRMGEGDSWEVERYVGGEWEKLVEPTLKLVDWMAQAGGVSAAAKGSLQRIKERFKQQGVLDLSEVEGA